ncbi:diguanylate cyclase (GGDEF)-like protein [Nocardia pseudobrasiliensis]|uniref:Diguanylate cyclase (GGDEF)-like protein n=2 Tax=Nocardia pseudobrasiliensis TaxID=45979 RepID=A0A370IAY8_9NOCA|nr:diguanylate cyclase (GGDEF)-like protein [Nocardia pseudobrasiliensis]
MRSRQLVRSWWEQSGHYRWLVQTIASKSALTWMKVVVGSGGMTWAVILVLAACSLPERGHSTERTVLLVCAGIAALWALRWWFLPVPVVIASILLLGGADIFVTVVSAYGGDRIGHTTGMILLIAIGIYFTFFHTPRVVAVHGVWSVLSAALLSVPVLNGEQPLAAVAMITAMVIICGVLLPGLQFGFWLLWTDVLSDPLTRLSSRRGLEYFAAQKIYHYPMDHVCMIMIDLDRFKAVNDTFGHHVGDEVLRNTARRLRAAAPSGSIIGRIGGEEFAVVTMLPPPGARVVAERLRRAVAAESDPVSITASFGLATLPPGGPRDRVGRVLTDLMHRADTAMYRAKQQGGNAIAVDEPWMMPSAPQQAAGT